MEIRVGIGSAVSVGGCYVGKTVPNMGFKHGDKVVAKSHSCDDVFVIDRMVKKAGHFYTAEGYPCRADLFRHATMAEITAGKRLGGGRL